jgi:hypothetical protein
MDCLLPIEARLLIHFTLIDYNESAKVKIYSMKNI